MNHSLAALAGGVHRASGGRTNHQANFAFSIRRFLSFCYVDSVLVVGEDANLVPYSPVYFYCLQMINKMAAADSKHHDIVSLLNYNCFLVRNRLVARSPSQLLLLVGFPIYPASSVGTDNDVHSPPLSFALQEKHVTKMYVSALLFLSICGGFCSDVDVVY